MAFCSLSFRCTGASTAGGVVASALIFGASLAQSQPINASSALRAPAPPVLRVAQTKGPDSFADVAEKVEPAVIGITCKANATEQASPDTADETGPNETPSPDHSDRSRRAPPGQMEAIAIGSGFFISPDGYAVTNSHVVEGNKTAEVRTSDNKTYVARLVGIDSLSDLALLKVDGRADFSYVKLADRLPRVGDWVLTVGNPYGLGGTVTAGIVSARERDIGTGSVEGFLQIDAPINSGDSGGPSFNADGDVIGVNSMIFSPSGGSSGVAFAIPAETVRIVIPQLREKGIVTRGSMGAEVQSVTSEIADSLGVDTLRGAIVASVQDNGPAAKAGIKGGDVITSAGGEPVRNANELTRKVHAMAPGSSIRLAFLRGGRESSLNVTLGQLPDQSPAPVTQGSAGSRR